MLNPKIVPLRVVAEEISDRYLHKFGADFADDFLSFFWENEKDIFGSSLIIKEANGDISVCNATFKSINKLTNKRKYKGVVQVQGFIDAFFDKNGQYPVRQYKTHGFTAKDFYDFSYDYLIKQTAGVISKKQLDDFINQSDFEYYANDPQWQTNSLNGVMRLGCIMLQDRQSMPNTVNFKKNEAVFCSVLGNFDPYYIIATYKDAESIKDAFKNQGIKTVDSSPKCFSDYTNGILSLAKYLSRYADLAAFKKAIEDEITKNGIDYLPNGLGVKGQKIDGFGFASVCNYLKELGFKEYSKPDTYIIAIMQLLNLVDDDSPAASFKAMTNIAVDAGVTGYALDRILWLICSGDYFRDGVKLKQKRDELRNKYLEALLNRYV